MIIFGNFLIACRAIKTLQKLDEIKTKTLEMLSQWCYQISHRL